MQLKNDRLMTAGQFAKKAEVTIRTIRFYDKIGLLAPSFRTSSGKRQYTMHDLARLQRILTLKYIGLTIDEIKGVIRQEGREEDLRESLRIQETIIRRKMEHLRLVHKAVKETLVQLDTADAKAQDTWEESSQPDGTPVQSGATPPWELFASIIRVVNQEEKWVDQYQDASNLHTRIRLHDSFSTNPYNWHLWLFDQLELPEKPCRILELGCGDGTLWQKNGGRTPDGWSITLSDFSEGMLQDAREHLERAALSDRFTFIQADVRSIPFPDGCFDAVLANHMLYHVTDREQALREIRRVLKPGGALYASTIGGQHLKEMKELLAGFNPDLVLSETDFAGEFGLDNGGKQLAAAGFTGVHVRRYEDALRITEAEPLIAYIQSTTGNSKSALSGAGLQKFRAGLEQAIRRDGSIGITKESGVFIGYK